MILYLFFLTGPELLGVGSLLKKYTALLCTHIGDILPVATSIASTSHRHFAEVSRVVDGDLTGSDLVFYSQYCQFNDERTECKLFISVHAGDSSSFLLNTVFS